MTNVFSDFAFKSTAQVKPYLGHDDFTGAVSYGDEVEIACTWIAVAEQARDNNGAEFVGRHTVYTADPRATYLSLIKLGDHSDWEEIRSVTSYDMAMFGTVVEYKLVTA